MKRKCSCGDSNLVADRITLQLRGVPFELTEDGPQYDDGEAEYSEGWDYNQDSRCHCASCGAIYEITSDRRGRPYLEPAARETKSR